MIRLGIIGTESSHTDSILSYVSTLSDVKISAILGDNPDRTKMILDKYSLDCEVMSPEDMIGRVDGIMVTLRDGAKHLDAVRPFFGHNIPLWIDKPYTASVDDAKELSELIKKHNTPFSGGSFIKLTDGVQCIKEEYNRIKDECMSGYLSFWTQLKSEYSGMHFYSHHLIESTLEVFGTDMRSVYAKLVDESLVVTASYDSFIVTMNYAVGTRPLYGGVFGKKSSFMTEIDFGNAENMQVDEFLEVIKTGKSPYSVDFFLTAVKISNAIEKSMLNGREVTI